MSSRFEFGTKKVEFGKASSKISTGTHLHFGGKSKAEKRTPVLQMVIGLFHVVMITCIYGAMIGWKARVSAARYDFPFYGTFLANHSTVPGP